MKRKHIKNIKKRNKKKKKKSPQVYPQIYGMFHNGRTTFMVI